MPCKLRYRTPQKKKKAISTKIYGRMLYYLENSRDFAQFVNFSAILNSIYNCGFLCTGTHFMWGKTRF